MPETFPTREPFHSNDIYEFHKYAEIYPLMNQEEVGRLGKSIKNHGQDQDIILYESKILDGRNTYLACRKENITPRFSYYNSDLDPLDYVRIRNSVRRHLSSAQKAAIALQFLQIERRRAKQRIACSQFQKQNMKNFTASNPGSLAINEEKKGRAIDIVAKEHKIAPKTLIKAEKIEKASRKDPEIKEKWEKAKKKELTIEEVYRAVKEKKETEIRKGIIDKFTQTGQTLLNNESSDTNHLLFHGCGKPHSKVIDQNNSIKKITFTKVKMIKPKEISEKSLFFKNKPDKDKCKYCQKATVIAIRCEECGHPTPKVVCDDDISKGVSRLRKPYLKKCENSNEV